MDLSKFDRIAKSVAVGRSRRGFLGTVLGAIAALKAGSSLAGPVAPCKLRKSGEICRKDGECCSNSCLPADSRGRRICGTVCTAGTVSCSNLCVDTLDDADNCGSCGTVCLSGPCHIGVCFNGSCDFETVLNQTECEFNGGGFGLCFNGQCLDV